MSSSLFKDLEKQRVKGVEAQQIPGRKSSERSALEWIAEHRRSQSCAYLQWLEENVEPGDLDFRIECINYALADYGQRSAELYSDPTIDQSRVGDLMRLEIGELRAERDRLYNQLRGVDAELGLQQEIGIER